jgi:hypothetical protein
MRQGDGSQNKATQAKNEGDNMAKYEIKTYKEIETHDGVAFTCTLYRDSKKVCFIDNDGWGGENFYDWIDHTTSDAYEAELKALALADEPQYEGNLDIYIDTLISQYEQDRKIKRWSKQGVVLKEGDRFAVAKPRRGAFNVSLFTVMVIEVARRNPTAEIWDMTRKEWVAATKFAA